MAALTDQQFLRYNRHIMMDKIGEAGQQAFINAKVLIIGMGGLGCPAAQYLAAAGVGQLTLIDHDVIELSNLQRQILYNHGDIGKSKSDVAATNLALQNPLITVTSVPHSIFEIELVNVVKRHDIILDCTDNVKTRRVINETCKLLRKKLVSASAIQGNGQLISFDFSEPNSPCYHCLFPESVDTPMSCSTSGVFSPILGVLGSLQATEALRLLLGETSNLNQLTLFDAWGMTTQKFKLNRADNCAICLMSSLQEGITE